MGEHTAGGRHLALQALDGHGTSAVPVGVFTWGFDYTWVVAGLDPWQLACGGTATWQRGYRALYETHRPDVMWYGGLGAGPLEPELLAETLEQWVIREGNSGREYVMNRQSLALEQRATGVRSCDPLGEIGCRTDADRLIPEPGGWGEGYLSGLTWLIEELGDRALVLPYHSPAYITACYAFGFEPAMRAMVDDPELFLYVCDRYAAGLSRRMEEWRAAGAEACFIADGWASCDIISPVMFERFALPYQRAIVAEAQAAGLKVILWNEGDVVPILDLEASVPADGFAVEQPRKGAETTVEAVREAFGPERCLLGNLDSEGVLLRGDPEEIAGAVDEQIRQSGPGAPFILSTGSPLPSNVRPSAVDAMIAAARRLPRGCLVGEGDSADQRS